MILLLDARARLLILASLIAVAHHSSRAAHVERGRGAL